MKEVFEVIPELGVTRYMDVEEDGTVHIYTEQDCSALVDQCKREANEGGKDAGIKRGLWHYAELPFVVIADLYNKGINPFDPNNTKRLLEEISQNYPLVETHAQKARFKILELPKSLKLAGSYYEQGELDKAWELIEKHLTQDPSEKQGLLLACAVLQKAGRNVAAYQFAKRLERVWPEQSATWTNLGTLAERLWLIEESESAHKKAVETATDPEDKLLALLNLGALYIQTGRFAEAENLCLESLKLGEHRMTRANLGMCQLARHEYVEGWKNFHFNLGGESRRFIKYGEEPEWQGEEGTVALYGEQGLGDEICFASIIPDAIARAKRTILDVDKRLVGLFRRSFPKASVYGTRADFELAWAEKDRAIDYSLAIGQLGEVFRNKAEDFPGTPYLIADPDRVTMWKSLFQSKGKPAIGIAWSGGVHHTGMKWRRLRIDDFLPVFKAVKAHWVSLEYKDRTEEIEAHNRKWPDFQVHDYPHATRTKDYDDAAGLIAALDCVVGIHTTSIHAAGGLGVKAHVLVTSKPQWRYAMVTDCTGTSSTDSTGR